MINKRFLSNKTYFKKSLKFFKSIEIVNVLLYNFLLQYVQNDFSNKKRSIGISQEFHNIIFTTKRFTHNIFIFLYIKMIYFKFNNLFRGSFC